MTWWREELGWREESFSRRWNEADYGRLGVLFSPVSFDIPRCSGHWRLPVRSRYRVTARRTTRWPADPARNTSKTPGRVFELMLIPEEVGNSLSLFYHFLSLQCLCLHVPAFLSLLNFHHFTLLFFPFLFFGTVFFFGDKCQVPWRTYEYSAGCGGTAILHTMN